ncbi:hypothetical protein [Mariprofundus ferrooxydans]|uniref:hypothetical protein n=1 Tax=Mariprofundus ferrooxydans TaxID=314344 RepID=UPI00036983E0|nr:hypothetical protein [Mariprofundus ferrooxydans]
MIDSGPQFLQLFASFWWVIPLFILINLFKSPWFKGFIGEVMLTYKQLNNSCLTPTPSTNVVDDYSMFRNFTDEIACCYRFKGE